MYLGQLEGGDPRIACACCGLQNIPFGNIMILALMILIFLGSRLEGLVDAPILSKYYRCIHATRDTALHSLMIWVVIALGILLPYRYIRTSP